MDERRQKLRSVREIVECYIAIFLKATREPENRHSETFLEACLKDYREKAGKADSFSSQEDCISTLHYLCLMCNLWLPLERKKAWLDFCTLTRFAKCGMVEDFETATLLARVEREDVT